jgi:hypothetical protein
MKGRYNPRHLESLEDRSHLSHHISARKRQWQRPYAVRKPEEYAARELGAIVEVDTLDVRPLPGMILKHFTARDIIHALPNSTAM